MSGPNPFDDVAEDVNESGDNIENQAGVDIDSSEAERESDVAVESSMTATSTKTDRDREAETTHTSSETFVEGPTLENSSPPFPYSDAEQKQMYVQDGLWDDFEDLKFDAELELRRTFDVRNVEQRELDTAVIRLALEQLTPTEIAKMVIQMRGFEPAEHR